MLMTCCTQQGFTLTELLVASALAVTVAIGITTMESSRVQMQEEILERSGLTSGQGEVALATVQLSERIAMADWARLDNAGGVFQFRIPTGCVIAACLDNPASYRWDQYRLAGGVLQLYTNTGPGGGCGTVRTVARNVTGLVFTEAPNELAYVLSWDNGMAAPKRHTHEFRGRVVSRARAVPGGALSPAPGPPGAC